MEVACGIETNQQIAECVGALRDFVEAAYPWFQLILSVAGIGTLALVSVLVWMLQRLRQDVESWQNDLSNLQNDLIEAKSTREDALSRLRSADKMVDVLNDQLKASTGPLNEALATANAQASRLARLVNAGLEAASGDSAEFWSRPPGVRADNYQTAIRDSKPILLFANQKGGVGKTTLSANMAAAFATRGERVLVVDLDYQGSLTSLMRAEANAQAGDTPSTVDLLFRDTLIEHWEKIVISSVSENLHYISCWYPFEKLERNLEYRWILEDTEDDIRFRLSRALLTPSIQGKYDRVIIDAPPRMTTGFLNGFCAATHLFVPTVVDHVSAVAVGTFAARFRELRTIINPRIEFAGIVGTMTTLTNASGPFSLPNGAVPASVSAENAVRKVLSSSSEFFIRAAVMARTPKVSYSAEEGIAYLQAPETRPMFNALADQIAVRAPLRV